MRIDLTRREVLELCASLRAYVRSMRQHAADDPTGAHDPAELDRLLHRAGQLIWRLEEAAQPGESRLVHSDDAIPPDADDAWS
ncbi:hypothetical protein C1I92_02510 [Jiangella anatolica]|uniref:Uncharacterized protein n=1 Tax=Jiangella anatolica TaxID=2670374 RepID=A0A2W2D0N1_9ACTN|nr:hypothetical protein C1I92_02510 [Jiangella anatolica]